MKETWVQKQRKNEYFKALTELYPIEVLYAVNLQRELQGGDTVNWEKLYEDSAIDFNKGGFNWADSANSSAFWYNVLKLKDFKLFYDEYKGLNYIADTVIDCTNKYERTVFNNQTTIRACIMCGKLKSNPEKYMAELPICNIRESL